MNSPHVILGDTRKLALLDELRRRGWGRMWIDRLPTPYQDERWGWDNGAYVWWTRKQPFNADKFQRRLERAHITGLVPYLAVLPDIVADGDHSFEFSVSWLDRVPRDWPWYLAVQDGMTEAQVGFISKHIAGVFLGGSNAFKHEAPRWATCARRLGLKFHYGRAGTIEKVVAAFACHADSLDSAFPLWSNERMQQFCRVYDHLTAFAGLRCERDGCGSRFVTTGAALDNSGFEWDALPRDENNAELSGPITTGGDSGLQD